MEGLPTNIFDVLCKPRPAIEELAREYNEAGAIDEVVFKKLKADGECMEAIHAPYNAPMTGWRGKPVHGKDGVLQAVGIGEEPNIMYTFISPDKLIP